MRNLLRFSRMYSFWISVFSLSVKTSNSCGVSLSHGCSRAWIALSRFAGSIYRRRLIRSLTSSESIVEAALGFVILFEFALV
jgi:hypothetical protein